MGFWNLKHIYMGRPGLTLIIFFYPLSLFPLFSISTKNHNRFLRPPSGQTPGALTKGLPCSVFLQSSLIWSLLLFSIPFRPQFSPISSLRVSLRLGSRDSTFLCTPRASLKVRLLLLCRNFFNHSRLLGFVVDYRILNFWLKFGVSWLVHGQLVVDWRWGSRREASERRRRPVQRGLWSLSILAWCLER